MKIYNVHDRFWNREAGSPGPVLDSLASDDDRLWPHENWPPMKMDRPLGPGASGGHGPVRYGVADYQPGKKVLFAFVDSGLSKGLNGCHFFEVVDKGDRLGLRHVIEAQAGVFTMIRWLLLIRPLHDALLEDALDKVERELTGGVARPARWSFWVRMLRKALAGGRSEQEH